MPQRPNDKAEFILEAASSLTDNRLTGADEI